MPSQPLYEASRPRPKTWIAATIAAVLLLSLPSILPPDGQNHAGQFLGRFHVGLIHLPIGLLLLLPVFDLGSRKHPSLRLAAGWTAGIAAASAVLTALLGTVLAHAGAFTGHQVRRHLWSGVALAIAALAVALLRQVLKQPAAVSVPLALFTVWAAHTGGAIVYGGNWLTEFAPKLASSRSYPPVDPNGEYATKIQPILNANCVKCHGPQERKANLRMDTYAHLMDGGASGDIISPGHPERSILVHRITLPLGDPKLMPKKGERLTEDEIATLTAWVAAGALPGPAPSTAAK